MTNRYLLTMILPWLMPLMVGLAGLAVTPKGEPPSDLWLSLAVWTLFPVAFWTALGFYGVVAVWLSERRQKAIAEETAEIRKTSWHYRFNGLLAGEEKWEPKTQCQYVALTLNNLGVLAPLKVVGYGILYVLKLLAWVGGFFVSFVPSIENWRNLDDDWYARKQHNGFHRQWIGPILGVVIPVVLLLQWDAGLQPLVLAVFLAMATGVILHKLVFFVLRIIWLMLSAPFKGLGALLDFLLVRRVVCKPARYV